MVGRHGLKLTTSLVLASGSLTIAQMPTYRVVEIPAPEGAPMAVALDLNNSNQVTGEALVNGEVRPFISIDGVTTLIDDIPGVSTTAMAINDDAHISGWMYEWGVIWPQAYVWDGTQNQPLGQQGDGYSYGQAMNDHDHVVGFYYPPGSHANGDAFINIDNVFYNLGSGQALDVNNAGMVVGQINRYFGDTAVWEPNGDGTWTRTVLDGLEAMAINESGTIIAGVGPLSSYFNTAAIWTRDGDTWTRTDIGDWDPETSSSIASDVNDAGQIIGTFETFVDPALGFISVDGTTAWLNDLLDASSSDWHVSRADAINESGTILAWAKRDGEFDRPVLLVPRDLTILGPRPGRAGSINELIAVGATPESRIFVVYAFARGSTDVPGCPGLAVDLAAPQIVGSSLADADGTARLSVQVPLNAKGRTTLLQSVDVDACVVSNVYRHTWR